MDKKSFWWEPTKVRKMRLHYRVQIGQRNFAPRYLWFELPFPSSKACSKHVLPPSADPTPIK